VKVLHIGTIVLLLTQIVFGGLTVLLQLHSKVVAAHLGMGTGFFALLLWTYLSLKEAAREEKEPRFPEWIKRTSAVMLAAVYGQIILGGLVASHYASLVCTDFPTCHGKWFPTFSGIIGLHVIHRLGAYTLFTLLLINAVLMWKKGRDARLARLAWIMFRGGVLASRDRNCQRATADAAFDRGFCIWRSAPRSCRWPCAKRIWSIKRSQVAFRDALFWKAGSAHAFLSTRERFGNWAVSTPSLRDAKHWGTMNASAAVTSPPKL
jgi:hypothetical protein